MGQSYRELIAWQKAMDFVMDVYRTTKTFPRDETYALAGQLRRAAVRFQPTLPKARRASPQRVPFFLARPEAHWSRSKLNDDRPEPGYFTPEHGKYSSTKLRVGENIEWLDRRHPAVAERELERELV